MVLNNYQKTFASPDGRYFILTTADEMRMSHWVESAQLVEAGSDRILVDIGSRSWSADSVTWAEDSTQVELEVRCYPGDCDGIRIRVFPDRSVAELRSAAGVQEVPFVGLTAAMQAHYERNKWDPGTRMAGKKD
jgi:hypothetical protein